MVLTLNCLAELMLHSLAEPTLNLSAEPTLPSLAARHNHDGSQHAPTCVYLSTARAMVCNCMLLVPS